MLPLEEPPLTRQQFAICFAQSEAELSLDLLLVNCSVGSEFLSSIHKNFEARVLKVFTNKNVNTRVRNSSTKTNCFYTVCLGQLHNTGPLLKVYIFTGSFGSFGSAVDERTRNNLNMG